MVLELFQSIFIYHCPFQTVNVYIESVAFDNGLNSPAFEIHWEHGQVYADAGGNQDG